MRPPTKYMLHTTVAIAAVAACGATDHAVGNSVWSIPPSNNFYSNWSDDKTFMVGDSLGDDDLLYLIPHPRFDTGLSDVTQVSKREHDGCTAENPFRRASTGPARVSLNEEGMAYFICSFGNYCSLGQKISIPVQGVHRREQERALLF